MIRYRQLTDAELAERDQPKPFNSRGLQGARDAAIEKLGLTIKKSAVKKRHYERKTEPPPRKVAGRHAAPPTRKP